MKITKPNTDEYNAFFQGYIDYVLDKDICQYLNYQRDDFISFLNAIPKEKWDFAYAEGKWTIKQLLRHTIDAERMFAYRAMCIARKDQNMLPGFGEDDYVQAADDSQNSAGQMIEEFAMLRSSNLLLINSFTVQATERMGNANGSAISVRAIIFIIAGHLDHHKTILSERYLSHV